MKKHKPSPTHPAPSLSHLKTQKKPAISPSQKKKLTTTKSTTTKPQPQDYIIINDSIYSANTFTERHSYEQFLHKVKKQKQIERRSFLVKSQVNEESGRLKKSNNEGRRKQRGWKKLGPQEFVQSLSLQEKKEMFLKLQQQIRAANSPKSSIPTNLTTLNNPSNAFSSTSFQSQPRQRINSQHQRQQKFSLLQQKLQNYKLQLLFKWQGQIDRLQQLHRRDKITLQQKETKVAIIEKLKDHKLKILDCTKTLFEKILKEDQYEQQHTHEKANKIQAILKSLHSFPSLENIDQHYYGQKEPDIGHLKIIKQLQVNEKPQYSPHKNFNFNNFDSSPLEIVEEDNNQHENFLDEFREGPWDKSNSKSVEDLKSPLNFLNNSPQKVRFAQFDDNNLSNHQYQQQHPNLNYPSNPLFSSTTNQLVQSQHIILTNKPLFTDGNEKISLKLDLRLDQVVFGQDQYPQCEKEEMVQLKPRSSEERGQGEKVNEDSQLESGLMDFNKSEVTSQEDQLNKQPVHQQQQNLQPQQIPVSNPTNTISPVSPLKVQKISLSKLSLSPTPTTNTQVQQLTCKQYPPQKTIINIPMILSKQKMQTLAFQQNRAFRQNLDNRIAFQMGCIELQPLSPSHPPPFHFTTLVDINTYIVGFYEFMMRKYMSSLVDNLNIPYGKSAIDKLYSLQTQGFVIEQSYNEMNNILSESHFIEYHRQIMFTMRKCTQYQTAHNRAIFEAFTKCINVYRPYFDLQGQVFPWIVSQKGITFYEITEDNIEQVFEKSKIKVLEYCTSLCGLHPPGEIKNQQQSALMTQKNEQNLTKTIKTQVLEQFEQWKIRFVNFECLVRMLVADKVYAEVLSEVVREIRGIEEGKDNNIGQGYNSQWK